MAKRKSAAGATLGAGIIFIVFGLVFFAVCLGIVLETKKFAETAQETTAVVYDVQTRRVRRNKKYRPRIRRSNKINKIINNINIIDYTIDYIKYHCKKSNTHSR